MKGSYKRIAAITLSLAMIAGNAGNFLTNSDALTAKALTVTAAEAQGKDESYFDAETGTLHLKGYVRNSENGSGVILPDGVTKGDVKRIVADKGTVLPKDCHGFIHGMYDVETIDLRNADASNVTDMSYMFCFEYDIEIYPDCSQLKSLDLSGFDTSNVTTMQGMFKNCFFVSELDLSSFDTSKVTDMSYMFCYFGYDAWNKGAQTKIKIDLSSFDTSNVTDMSNMFSSCGLKTPVDLSHFDTSNVTDMSYMFGYCYHMPKINISSFDTRNVTNMRDMFNDCWSLETIIVGDGWSTDSVEDSDGMFTWCNKLKGGAGTTVEFGNDDIEYAHVDGGKENPGYFTYKKDVSYFDAETKTLHLKEYVQNGGEGTGLILPEGVNAKDVINIVAEEGTVLPKDCSYFCRYMPNLKSVDLKNADTSNVTDMSYMFSLIDGSSQEISYIDVSGFDTSKVTNMTGMFEGYFGTELDVSGFDTSKVTDMSQMFWYCRNMKKIDLRNFNTSNVKYMDTMFSDCKGLESLNISSFDTSNVTNMTYMFGDCPSLETIIVGDGWSTKSDEGSTDVFTGSVKLKGGAGTVYDRKHINLEYAHVDGGKKDPGYFTKENKIDESYFDAETKTLHLKGYVKNNEGIILPAGVDRWNVKHIVADEGTVLPENCSWLMYDMGNVETVDLKNADTSNVTDMSYMFCQKYIEFIYNSNSSSIKSLDLSGLDTSNVTNMEGMFRGCSALSELDLSSFDPSNVTKMDDMFKWCVELRSLNLSSFDTRNVKSMRELFTYCVRLKSLDLSRFNTSNVTDMHHMFYYCNDLESLDLSSFDTSNVTDMSEMFMYCSNLGSLDISSFDTSNVTDMSEMFMYCSNLKSLDLSSFDTSSTTDMSGMFCDCSSLESLDLSNFGTSNITSMSCMFYDCSSLGSLDLCSFNTSNLISMRSMFSGCLSLESLDLSIFDTSNVTDMGDMFYDCSSLESLDLSNFDTSNVKSMYNMFYGCKSLETLDLSSFDTSNVRYMGEMFWGCSSLESLDLSSFDTSKVYSMYWMFRDCNKLSKIYVGSGWSTESAEGNEMFDGCESLVGGAGTAYDADHVDVDYAHVDGGKNDPGYLTFKENNFFKTQNLILSGQIGVSFNLDLSSLTEQERNASYMEFKVNGRTSKVPFDKNSKNASGKYYSFTCYVTSVEMADTIKAVFHYGNKSIVSKKYSVLDYINAIEKNASSFDNKTLYLIRSIADYGHYSQPFLAASNNWTIGSEHMEMSKHYTNSYSYDAIRNVTSKYQRVLDLGKSDIEKITYSLSLNSGTSLNVFIKAKDNYKGSVKVTTKKGNTVMSYTAVKQSDGRYKVTIPDISAHQLGDTYTITASTTNGTATCSLSALSYVYAVLNGNSNDKNAKNAVSSLYIYYDATLNYRSKA